MKRGIDTLFLPHYVNIVKEEIPEGYYFSSFVNLFGISKTMKAIEEVLYTGRPGGVRVHAIWEDNHNYNPGKHDATIVRTFNEYVSLANRYPNQIFEFSPFCECNQNLKAILDRLSTTPTKHGNVRLVNSTAKNIFVTGYKNEVHGSASKAPSGLYNFSYDGEDSLGADVEAHKAKFAGADIFWMWSPALNLKKKVEDRTPRERRTYRPKAIHIDALLALFRTKDGKNIGSNYTSKPMSEDSGDAKSNKLVFISPIRTGEIRFESTTNGQLIAAARYYGTFAGGGFRYYAPLAGFEISDRAMKITGRRAVNIKQGGKLIGTVDVAFRAGKFR